MVEFRLHAGGAGSTPAFDAVPYPIAFVAVRQHFRRVAGLGYRFIRAWSRVRVPPPAPDAGVAQW